MSIERGLAEIDILAQDIDKHATSELQRRDQYRTYLNGIVHEAKALHYAYASARRALRKGDDLHANRFLGMFAAYAKNLADNLNLFIQAAYGKSTPDLKRLSDAAEAAPKTKAGKSIYHAFTATHNGNGKTDFLVRVRNANSHGNGASIVRRDKTAKSGYVFAIPGSSEDPAAWLETKAEEYMTLTKTCLETIVDGDKNYFVPHATQRSSRIMHQRIVNAYGRHKSTATITAASALIATGVAASLSSQAIMRSYEAKRNAEHRASLEQTKRESAEWNNKALILGEEIDVLTEQASKYTLDLIDRTMKRDRAAITSLDQDIALLERAPERKSETEARKRQLERNRTAYINQLCEFEQLRNRIEQIKSEQFQERLASVAREKAMSKSKEKK
jgi:hypothetical protein